MLAMADWPSAIAGLLAKVAKSGAVAPKCRMPSQNAGVLLLVLVLGAVMSVSPEILVCLNSRGYAFLPQYRMNPTMWEFAMTFTLSDCFYIGKFTIWYLSLLVFTLWENDAILQP